METTDAWYTAPTSRSLEDASRAVEAALAARRFSVLWAFDVHEKLREKGLEAHGRCRILEVCSAPRAKEALDANPRAAYFLPCKVVVQEREGRTEIGLARPTALIGMLGDPALRPLAEDVERTLVAAAQEAART